MNKKTEILEYLKSGGTLTSAEAFEKFGTTKLTSRISELRIRYNIGDRWEKDIDKFGKEVKFKRYFYISEKKFNLKSFWSKINEYLY